MPRTLIGGNQPRRAQLHRAATAQPEPVTLTEWTLSMSPADYLERFPEGPNAELAKAHITADDS